MITDLMRSIIPSAHLKPTPPVKETKSEIIANVYSQTQDIDTSSGTCRNTKTRKRNVSDRDQGSIHEQNKDRHDN